jgi:hypothetical protein
VDRTRDLEMIEAYRTAISCSTTELPLLRKEAARILTISILSQSTFSWAGTTHPISYIPREPAPLPSKNKKGKRIPSGSAKGFGAVHSPAGPGTVVGAHRLSRIRQRDAVLPIPISESPRTLLPRP